ncbi:uncharacterized protein F4817DRAFT_346079 [Daldinia loculata]|uniref:uncharacterized protein n=1 Tax=Daldinia loculata TaxID=103429 RepID=UPI0020C3E266|nr:uncharacterized protein F4817DRAFT_346079 [Daldinia loculata]KAI1644699.1 hypothetical protein F4817DRAFT_346079 [Daldinia loculata]
MSSDSDSPSLFEVDYGPRLLRILTPVSVIVTFAVGLRIIMRIYRTSGIGIDDWLSIVSLVFSWAQYALVVLLVKIGEMGRSINWNEPQGIIDLKVIFASRWIYATTILTTKLSILMMYRRIFPVRLMKIGYLVLGSITIVWWAVYVLVETFQCTPVKKLFDPEMNGYCIPLCNFLLGIVIPNIVTDIAILCLPIYEIMNLHLTRSQRATLSVIFLLGTGAIVASGIRLRYQIQLAYGTSTDFTLVNVNFILWTTLEPDLAIICGCLPVLGPLFNSLLRMRPFTWIRQSLGRDYDNVEGDKTPVTIRALRSIGGTSMHRGKIGKGNKSQDFRISHGSIRPFRNLEDDSDSVEVNSHGHSREANRGTFGLWPQGYAAECCAVVRKTGGDGVDEVPLGVITVETVVDWRENSSSSDTV